MVPLPAALRSVLSTQSCPQKVRVVKIALGHGAVGGREVADPGDALIGTRPPRAPGASPHPTGGTAGAAPSPSGVSGWGRSRRCRGLPAVTPPPSAAGSRSSPADTG